MQRAPQVVVVGASAAGLAAAASAAREGASVLLLESREEIGVPEPPALVAFDFLWDSSFVPPAASVRRRLDGVRLQSPSGHALEVAAPLCVLDRTRFDRHLAEQAARAGATLRLGVRDLRLSPSRALLLDGEELRAPVVVFADGARSLARSLVRTTRHPDGLTWGATLRFDSAGADDDRLLSLTFGQHARGGRSQLTPLGRSSWAHWTFYRGAPDEGEATARRALALDARLRGMDPRVAREASYHGVAPDPVHTIPGRLADDGLLVVGGAGGQGGLEVGVSAGEQAGRVAARCALEGRTDRQALGAYERAWKREHVAGYRALRRHTRRLARLDDEGLDRLLRPWAGWRVPVHDLVALGHGAPLVRAGALARFAARNPQALPRTALLGLRMLIPKRA